MDRITCYQNISCSVSWALASPPREQHILAKDPVTYLMSNYWLKQLFPPTPMVSKLVNLSNSLTQHAKKTFRPLFNPTMSKFYNCVLRCFT